MKKSYNTIGSIGFAFMLTLVCGNLKAQTKTVTGTVTVNDQPLSGVSVSQEGSDQTAVTNTQGSYQLQITGENNVLIFRHPEYTEQRISANNQSVINLTLDPKVKGIEEVVINAGYYKVKDKERTGSIAKISAKDIENQPVTNVLASAQGRMAGVNISQNGGTPGGGYQIEIRGRNSLRTRSNSEFDGNQPLYVVDGVVLGSEVRTVYAGSSLPNGSINPLNSINPNDIESFEILKDADATAIYGSRGANGVVLVTTKKGKAGKVSLSFTSNYGLSSAISNLSMMNTEQYLGMRRQAFANSNISTYPANAYDINGTWDQNRSTDWPEKLIGNTSTFSDIRGSVSGGNEQTGFIISLGHTEQTTPFGRGFRYVTNSLNNSISHRSKDKKLEINVSNIFSLLKNNVINTDVTAQAFLLAPNAPELYLPDGSINWANGMFTNPVAAFNGSYTNDSKQLITNLTASYEVLKNIRLKLNGGINYQNFEEWSLQPNTIYSPTTSLGLSSATSKASKSSQNRFSLVVEPQLTWDFQRNHHKINIIVGGTLQQDSFERGSMTGTGFESNVFIRNIAAAKTKTFGDQLETEYKYTAVFGRVNYQYDGKYIVNLTGRRDGSSRFGPNNRFANFGAIGAAWLFSKETLFKNIDWLSFAKLRGSYGVTGSDNIGDYQYLDTYTVSTLIYNGTAALIPSRLFNPDYSWENTYKLETALEASFFKNRFNLTASWYRNRSSNQLVGYQLPAVTGFTSVLANMPAEVENTGWEFELSADPFKDQALRWDTSFNISFPKNRLVAFPGLEGSTYSNTYIVGQPITIVKLYNLEGIDPNSGKYIFTDYNGDGKISAPDDTRAIENLGVRYFGGWNNRLTYKNFEFSFLFQFVKQKNRNFNSTMPSPGLMSNLPVDVLNVWSPQNADGLYMPYQSTVNPLHAQFQNSTASVSDASFIRLKNVQLGYQIPVENTFFRNARIYIQGQNLLTVTKYFGYDPEFPSMSFLPPMKTYSMGVQLTF
ncbi:SusC/RagA family TonB-linked outer membrane protein [Chryseobacterium sp. PBS4-4]|uniref:SusC/RagA family TonB-linked outer membrane protein n=1 Tax=Chryseobacterium edaphi TaxID=2976532 RepID=A0ABT2WCX6_9FLAO|nr:SusC/RagA family TonB-linked outer membrane protein [Chryseobacterium edaphi]MCU7618470.1 SusC/RagA family TonB-linked outer membrane protein [Chryseobacterium edaphi]